MDIPSQTLKGKRILIVEDDSALRGMFVQLFKSRGLDVHEEMRGDRAYPRTLELRPDLILMDLNLPGMNGTEACAQVKADPRVKDAVVVMITGDMKSVPDKIKGFALGADDYVLKPCDLAVLLARIESLLAPKKDPS